MKKIMSLILLLLTLSIATLADGGPAPQCMPCPDGHGGRTWCCPR